MNIPVRRRRRKKSNTSLYVLIGICGALLVALIIVACCLAGKNNIADGGVQLDDKSLPALTVDKVEEQGESVIISTSYARLKFPFAFCDLIHVRANDGQHVKQLEFYTVLEGKEYRLFDVILGGSQGIRLGDLKVPGRSDTVPVFAKLYDADPNLEQDMLLSFRAAQECFNDIAQSLHDNEGYTPMR